MIVRSRVRLARGGVSSRAGVVIVGLLALGVAYYAATAVALGLGAAPARIDDLTGYRSVVEWLAGPLRADAGTRAIVAVAALVAAGVLGRLALAQLPRPRVPRSALVLEHDVRGSSTVLPRAIERAVEGALPEFDSVAARWENGRVTVIVTGTRPRALSSALTTAPGQVAQALRRHGLPDAEIQVVLRRVRPSSTREIL